MTKIYFASHQYDNNLFECNQFILISLERQFTGTWDAVLGKPQYFSLNIDESEILNLSCWRCIPKYREYIKKYCSLRSVLLWWSYSSEVHIPKAISESLFINFWKHNGFQKTEFKESLEIRKMLAKYAQGHEK